MPTLLQRPGSPYWYVRVQRNGREFWRSTRETGKARAEARALKLLQAIQDQAYGGALPAPDPWVGVWWTGYWEARTGSVARSAASKGAYVEAHLGKWRLRQLRPSHFTAYVAARRAAGAADSTISLEGRLLRLCLRAAQAEGLLERDPTRGVQWPTIGIRARVLTAEEEDALCAAAPPWLARWITVSLGTGLRGAELHGLTVPAIAWDTPSLAVLGKGQKRREVPLWPSARRALLAQVGERTAGRVWPSASSPTQAVTSTNHAIRRAWRRAGCAGPSPTTHTFRHTFATRFLQQGGDIYLLSKLLGHASVTVTERVYAHLLAADLLRRALRVQMP
jgi:integrase